MWALLGYVGNHSCAIALEMERRKKQNGKFRRRFPVANSYAIERKTFYGIQNYSTSDQAIVFSCHTIQCSLQVFQARRAAWLDSLQNRYLAIDKVLPFHENLSVRFLERLLTAAIFNSPNIQGLSRDITWNTNLKCG